MSTDDCLFWLRWPITLCDLSLPLVAGYWVYLRRAAGCSETFGLAVLWVWMATKLAAFTFLFFPQYWYGEGSKDTGAACWFMLGYLAVLLSVHAVLILTPDSEPGEDKVER